MTDWVLSYLRHHPFPRFCLVGGTGVLIDATLLMLLHELFGFALMPARFTSVAIALTAGWLLNRTITFQNRASRNRLYEWARYIAVNSIGAAINLTIFFLLTQAALGTISRPLVALAIASVSALWFNYVGMRALVFKGSS